MWVCVVIFFIVFGAMFWSIFKHRKSAGAKAAQFHENTTIEVIWTIVPFVVLIGANMPSILAEISFLSNPSDERLLKRSSYREKIAEALYHGILNYAQNLGGIKVAQRGGPISHP